MSALAAYLALNTMTVGIIALIGFFLEEVMRARRSVSATTQGRGLRFNLGCGVLYYLAEGAFAVGARVALVAFMAELPGAGVLHLPLFGATSPLAVFGAACVYAVLLDFFNYWFHRAQHRFAWLWAIHELHHSDERMNVTTTFRHHWLQGPLEAIVIGAPLAYLTVPTPSVAAVAGIVIATAVYFDHVNAPIRFGGWILVSPQYHRIHHSAEPRHIDRNFAAVTPIWDVLFGTYYQPGKDEYPATGLIQGGSPRTVIEAAVLPFRRWRGERVAVVDGEPAVD